MEGGNDRRRTPFYVTRSISKDDTNCVLSRKTRYFGQDSLSGKGTLGGGPDSFDYD